MMCVVCGKESGQRVYCGGACRQKAFRKKHGYVTKDVTRVTNGYVTSNQSLRNQSLPEDAYTFDDALAKLNHLLTYKGQEWLRDLPVAQLLLYLWDKEDKCVFQMQYGQLVCMASPSLKEDLYD